MSNWCEICELPVKLDTCPVALACILPVTEIYNRIHEQRLRLKNLAPINGTVTGARAIAECRATIETLEADLARREALNSPNQEDR